ncbi:MAG: nickel pincer cofactor biosynthesis protein LarC [Synergistaceae bacterium]|jgi:uncharacterized protein (TIGR00299 family) protein|nr:nickel pincer cofactor biosynthesis protein LarC [Synergistaceae bacterium]
MLGTNGRRGARRILYLNGAAGISGDMFIGALSDIAASLDGSFSLAGLFKKTGLLESIQAELSVRKDARGGLTGVKVDVADSGGRLHHGHGHKNLSDILGLLNRSDLPQAVRDAASQAFTLLAETEADVHGVTPDEIYFHEVGAADSVADITGAMLLMDHLGWPEVISSPVNVGSGTVNCSHGVLPVPAPATALLLKGMKIFSSGVPMERTTPTGALLLRTLAGGNAFGDLPSGKVLCVGIGLGSKDTPDIPNALVAMLIEPDRTGTGRFLHDEPSIVEANIDDMNPQDFARIADEMLEQGALDVWRENIMMKKGRLAVKLCCLCHAHDADRFAEMMLTGTTTLGVRISQARRLFFERKTDEAMTSLGPVRVKSAILDGRTFKITPEYDDLLKIANEKDLPLWSVRKTVEREIGA